MASLRKLRRRERAWKRYLRHYRHLTSWAADPWPHHPPGYWRAVNAVTREQDRRAERDRYWPTWCSCPGCMTGGRCIEDGPDDSWCCNAGDEGHPGPCATTCFTCGGDGRCPDCGGIDDMGCDLCGGSLSCPDCWGQGEHVEDVYVGPRVETLAVDRGLL